MFVSTDLLQWFGVCKWRCTMWFHGIPHESIVWFVLVEICNKMLYVVYFHHCKPYFNKYSIHNMCQLAPIFNDKFLKGQSVIQRTLTYSGHMVKTFQNWDENLHLDPWVKAFNTTKYFFVIFKPLLSLQSFPTKYTILSEWRILTSHVKDEASSLLSPLNFSPRYLFSVLHFSPTTWHITYFICLFQSLPLHWAGSSVKPGAVCCMTEALCPTTSTMTALDNCYTTWLPARNSSLLTIHVVQITTRTTVSGDVPWSSVF